MRTLHADLTTAQQSSSRTPYLSVVFKSRDRATTRTYLTTDATNRLVFVQQLESWFDEDKGGLDVSESGLPISGIVRLDDFDQAINVLDFKGYRCDIGWGFNTASGDRVSNGPPMFVAEQRSISYEGHMHVELLLMSLWDLLRIQWQKQTVTTRIEYAKDVEVRHILMELLGGTIADAAVLHETGVAYTSYTDAAKDPTDGADLGSADDVTLMPNPGSVSDAFYLGLATTFDTVSLDITQVGVGTWTTQVEYWNGTVWGAVSGEVDNTSAYTVGKLKTITFDKPTDWAAQNLNSTDAAFPNSSLYYIRIRVLTWSATTTQPKATKIVVGHDYSISLDSAVAGQGDDDKPQYSSDFAQNITATIHDILAESLLAVFVQQDGFHVKHVDDTLTPIDYTYDTDHSFNVGALRDAPIIPNKVTYTNVPPGSVDTRHSGSDTDTDSETALGTLTEIVVDDTVSSGPIAVTRAQRAIKRLKRNGSQGTVTAPMNVGQEVWDVARVQDSRSGKTYDGRVSRLVRTFQVGIYQIQIHMGGVDVEWTPFASWNRYIRPWVWRSMPEHGRQSVQAETFSSSGKYTAGDGAVVIDKDGILFNAAGGGYASFDGASYKNISLWHDQVGAFNIAEVGSGTKNNKIFLDFDKVELEDDSGISVLMGNSVPWTLEVQGNIVNDTDSNDDIGSSTKAWANIYGDKVFTDGIQAFSVAPQAIDIYDDVFPSANNLHRVGSKASTKTFLGGSFFTLETDQIDPITGTTFNINGILRSTPGGPWDFGTSTHYFDNGYINALYTNQLRPRTGSDISLYASVYPDADSTRQLGSQALTFTEVHTDECFAGVASMDQGDVTKDVKFTETTDPTAASNAGKLYTKDNGSGKTQLAVRFGTGAVQVIATEP